MNFFHKNEILSLHDSRVYRVPGRQVRQVPRSNQTHGLSNLLQPGWAYFLNLNVQFSNVECAMSPVVEDLTDDRKACEECAIDWTGGWGASSRYGTSALWPTGTFVAILEGAAISCTIDCAGVSSWLLYGTSALWPTDTVSFVAVAVLEDAVISCPVATLDNVLLRSLFWSSEHLLL